MKYLVFDDLIFQNQVKFGVRSKFTSCDNSDPRTPKSKRKEKSEREASERKAKTRRDSEPAQQPEEETEKAHLSINS